ncbi:MAG: hypothetical protein N3A53_02080 [Verrucomicrobiae bacterium]|nr:hypothetical protein [Verrucomicrobiae bacterium]
MKLPESHFNRLAVQFLAWTPFAICAAYALWVGVGMWLSLALAAALMAWVWVGLAAWNLWRSGLPVLVAWWCASSVDAAELQITNAPNGQVAVRVVGAPDKQFWIEDSTDLQSWSESIRVFGDGEWVVVQTSNLNPFIKPKRFFRLGREITET